MCGSLVRVQVSSPLQSWSPSSRGPGHRPFTAVTGVRIPQGTPLMRQSHFRFYRKWLFSSVIPYCRVRPRFLRIDVYMGRYVSRLSPSTGTVIPNYVTTLIPVQVPTLEISGLKSKLPRHFNPWSACGKKSMKL